MTRLALRGLYVGAVAAYAGVLLVVAVALPDRVPLHFGPSGEADSYGSRGEAVTSFVVVGVVVLLLHAAGRWAVRRVSTRWVNVPEKQWWTATPARVRTLRGRLAEDLDLVGTATFLLLAGVVAMVGRAARDDTGLGTGIWVLVGVYVVVLLGWGLVVVPRRYRPSSVEDDPDA